MFYFPLTETQNLACHSEEAIRHNAKIWDPHWVFAEVSSLLVLLDPEGESNMFLLNIGKKITVDRHNGPEYLNVDTFLLRTERWGENSWSEEKI